MNDVCNVQCEVQQLGSVQQEIMNYYLVDVGETDLSSSLLISREHVLKSVCIRLR